MDWIVLTWWDRPLAAARRADDKAQPPVEHLAEVLKRK